MKILVEVLFNFGFVQFCALKLNKTTTTISKISSIYNEEIHLMLVLVYCDLKIDHYKV